MKIILILCKLLHMYRNCELLFIINYKVNCSGETFMVQFEAQKSGKFCPFKLTSYKVHAIPNKCNPCYVRLPHICSVILLQRTQKVSSNADTDAASVISNTDSK